MHYALHIEIKMQSAAPKKFRQRSLGECALPYDDAVFDMVINRHGDFNVKDIRHMLKATASSSQNRWAPGTTAN